LRLLLVLVFSALLCCGCVLGKEGDVSGPELVWEIFDPSPIYVARGVVPSGDGGFAIAAERSFPFPSRQDQKNVVLMKVDRWGSKVWESVYGGENTTDRVFSVVAARDGGTESWNTTYAIFQYTPSPKPRFQTHRTT
jgi:hypothetical protein